MKPLYRFLFLGVLFVPCIGQAQSGFSPQAYSRYLEQTANLSAENLLQQNPLPAPIFSRLDAALHPKEFAYFDSLVIKYGLTTDEIDLLQEHHFVVTERLNFDCFGRALHDIYIKDLPVFVTTDAVLHALHASYDRLLMDLESAILEPNLVEAFDGLARAYHLLQNKYESKRELVDNLGDVDTYITVARSLLAGEALAPVGPYSADIREILQAIEAEQVAFMPLFCDRSRRLDFSQFTVRGHYTQELPSGKTLANYFRCMMWLGRIDFLLTPPPENPWEEPWSPHDIRRMTISAFMLNELLELAEARTLLDENDRFITFMVGESDNLTPNEFRAVADSLHITDASMLLDDETYDRLQAALLDNTDAGQRILSNFFLMDPFSAEPDPLPVSYRLSGQRFIIDSYYFSNVVYDRIIFNGQKVWRPLPDPLDAMFVLGNNAALPLLRDELERYSYAGQLAALRYLTDAFDPDFWSQSLYNVWLQTLRTLNPAADRASDPLFMQTAAWQQQKLNTQLASWAQLRHDNLLYAKQSYTGGTGCSYPVSFVEPYPDFFNSITHFAEIATKEFDSFSNTTYEIVQIKNYFARLKTVAQKLTVIAQKEIDDQPFSDEETDWLQKMLFVEGGSGMPPFSGWYADLYYLPEKAAEGDYVIADVHTQPTDQAGAPVGRVLHVGVGQINLCIVLAHNDGQPIAFVGPVMSYYEQITDQFKRLTDEEWSALVLQGNLPARPDWVNSYLTNTKGAKLAQGRTIPGTLQTPAPIDKPSTVEGFSLQNYPNPFNPQTTIDYSIRAPGPVRIAVYDALGRLVETLTQSHHSPGRYRLTWSGKDRASGIYYCRIESAAENKTIKLLLLN